MWNFPTALLVCTEILVADWPRRLHHPLHLALEGCIAGPAGVVGGGSGDEESRGMGVEAEPATKRGKLAAEVSVCGSRVLWFSPGRQTSQERMQVTGSWKRGGGGRYLLC